MNQTAKRSMKTVGIILIAMYLGVMGMGGGHLIAFYLGGPFELSQLSLVITGMVYLVAAVEVMIAIHHLVLGRNVKADGYSDEENSVFTRAEKKVNTIQGIGTTISVAMVPIYAAWMTYGGSIETWQKNTTIVAFFIIVVFNFVNEVAILRLCAKVNPKMDVDWSKMSLNEDMYQKMDECEREQMGRLGAKLVNSIHVIFAIAMLAVLFLSPIFAFSGYELALVGVLWGVFSLFITIEKNKIIK